MNSVVKGQRSKVKGRQKIKVRIAAVFFGLCVLACSRACFAQDGELEITIDATAKSLPLPKVFRPNIDLSGRGNHHDASWPQSMAAREVLDLWQKDIGFGGLYRMQYNLWEISQLAKDKDAQNKLLANYEETIKKISDAGGVVILDIFGTPAGLGRALDKKAPPWDMKAFKEVVKDTIRRFSCEKKYNVWYEVWNAPDLDDFFLGRKQEYFNLYRAVAESVEELEVETRVHIPVGAPAVSWWFQNLDGNTILTPEKSLIYEFIKFCYRRHLPLDFISWHGFSSDPKVEVDSIVYKKTAVGLVRDWLNYFGFDRSAPLIVDEWNYDRSANVLPERSEKSYILASYIPVRIKNMYEAGIDYQLFFSLEDFKTNPEGVVRNTGIFSFDPERAEYKGTPKAAYNVFRMLQGLGTELLAAKGGDDFTGVIATKKQDGLVLVFYNYIDPETAVNFLSKNIIRLSNAERKAIVALIKSGDIRKILSRKLNSEKLHTTRRVKALLKKACQLHDVALTASGAAHTLKLDVKNLEGHYSYQRFVVDSSCSANCPFESIENKEIDASSGLWQTSLSLTPYSVQMLVLTSLPPKAAAEQGRAVEPAFKPAEAMQEKK